MKHLLAIIVACSLVTSIFAQGNFEGITSTSGASASGLFSGTAGWAFQAANSFEVAELGVFDYLLQETPIGPVTVALWAENGTLLASADVSNTSPPVNQSRYTSITPVLLTAGQTYYLGAFRSTGFTINVFGPGMGQDSAFAATLNILYLGLASTTSATLAKPQLETGGASLLYAGPNFRVPEPSSFALMALGMAGFALYRRGRQ